MQNQGMDDNSIEKKKKSRTGRIVFWVIVLEVLGLGCGLLFLLIPRDDEQVKQLLEEDSTIRYETESETELPLAVPRPDIDEQLLTVNPYSRPGKKVKSIDKIVVHYLANPETSAQQNHDYFESLKDLRNDYMSANYVIGLEGEIIECVPDGEVAWASNQMNSYSISIENCHMDTTGRFNKATYWSDVHLVAYLTEKYGLGRDDIIRHYDVTGKICPKYFVEHPDAWEKFKDDVMDYREKSEQERDEKLAEKETQGEDILAKYLEQIDVTEAATEADLWNKLAEHAQSAGLSGETEG